VDGQTVEAAKKSFDEWIEPMLQSIHRQGHRAPDIRRVYIPKPGKTEKRPLGVSLTGCSTAARPKYCLPFYEIS
jgi:RNA-directed DNA polymerase